MFSFCVVKASVSLLFCTGKLFSSALYRQVCFCTGNCSLLCYALPMIFFCIVQATVLACGVQVLLYSGLYQPLFQPILHGHCTVLRCSALHYSLAWACRVKGLNVVAAPAQASALTPRPPPPPPLMSPPSGVTANGCALVWSTASLGSMSLLHCAGWKGYLGGHPPGPSCWLKTPGASTGVPCLSMQGLGMC